MKTKGCFGRVYTGCAWHCWVTRRGQSWDRTIPAVDDITSRRSVTRGQDEGSVSLRLDQCCFINTPSLTSPSLLFPQKLQKTIWTAETMTSRHTKYCRAVFCRRGVSAQCVLHLFAKTSKWRHLWKKCKLKWKRHLFGLYFTFRIGKDLKVY